VVRLASPTIPGRFTYSDAGRDLIASNQPWSGTVHRSFVLSVAALMLPLASLLAQANPGAIKARNDCRLAAQIVRTGQPATKAEWAWDMIHACPEAGDASSAALDRLRSDGDTAHFTPVIRVAFNVRDGKLFATALNVAGDGSASPTAREASFIVLVSQITEDQIATFDGISRATAISVCPLNTVNDRGVPTLQSPLPPGAAASAGRVASSVVDDPDAPEPVRVAADCIRQAIRQRSLGQP